MSAQPESQETWSQGIARRLRMQFAAQRVTQKEAARLLGMNPTVISRRMNGEIEWSFDEVDTLHRALGFDLMWVLGLNDRTPSQNRDGVLPIDVRPPGLEPGTH
ncbi:helix-turn-helix transcriptional regulator [Sinomonas sp. ASV322]|uniref:helix-turn-helix domain-containing protein n=1 Tax=Sinomonas sp. ASV322 TaxID=3041920 RepID=UPI0027DC1307|nr:helix-turn-helix transcriptional regulator [Sinomonas sp. ASV322]MDQ4502154.1 helix-turn-helix transcriptional regulator [Sinomonas sp. ASV322]